MVVVAKVGGCSIRVLQVHSPRKVATLTQSCGLIRCPSLTMIDINDILALWMLVGPYAVLRTSVVGCGGGDTGARCSLTRRIKIETPICLVSLACSDPEVLCSGRPSLWSCCYNRYHIQHPVSERLVFKLQVDCRV